MANIQILDQNTINKIAAGEVIERPASVVKELLENAIDAKATAITVEIRDGGISFIRVTDNGCGIPKDEISLAFLRHSTSKIRSVEDLFFVSSLGFRGEALSSIAAVAQVEVITRMEGKLTGIRYQIEGGVEKGMEEIGAPEGTTFIARNLFYNTPVRKKFLKTAMTEGAHVGDLVEKIALSHPEISIRLIQNNQNKLYTSGNNSLKDIIYTVYGREITANLLDLHTKSEAVFIQGFIGKPVIARNNRSFENYFINGRYIKSNLISKAIEEAYHPFMMQHKYPFTMLQLTIEPELLDVNVHPTKMELRFQNGERIFQTVKDSIIETLSHRELIPKMELIKKSSEPEPKKEEKQQSREKRLPLPEPFEQKRLAQWKKEAANTPQPEKTDPSEPMEKDSLNQKKLSVPEKAPVQKNIEYGEIGLDASHRMVAENRGNYNADLSSANSLEKQMDLFEDRLLSPKSRSRHKLIGQLFDTYWLVEFHEQLYIIDQHAAHEKVLYERTMEALAARKQTSQMVDPPIILTLSRQEELLLSSHKDIFQEIGFEIEPFGGREYAVRAVPDNLFSLAEKELLTELFDSLCEDGGRRESTMIYEKVASMSCKAAVKGNHSMSAMEADQLIDQLLKLKNPYACPHGRPTIISMSKYELEKRFKRIV
ncbi:MAG: DNA mismatch repair endonuclease MutL [Lachnospiraceae bacterium]|jgi:DNA mismatch repair protein MutL|nr:DNA mismatch repair endonuclease MutL [Lachnospiraceae bacterium]